MFIPFNSEISQPGINPICRFGQVEADVATRLLIAALFITAKNEEAIHLKVHHPRLIKTNHSFARGMPGTVGKSSVPTVGVWVLTGPLPAVISALGNFLRLGFLGCKRNRCDPDGASTKTKTVGGSQSTEHAWPVLLGRNSERFVSCVCMERGSYL